MIHTHSTPTCVFLCLVFGILGWKVGDDFRHAVWWTSSPESVQRGWRWDLKAAEFHHCIMYSLSLIFWLYYAKLLHVLFWVLTRLPGKVVINRSVLCPLDFCHSRSAPETSPQSTFIVATVFFAFCSTAFKGSLIHRDEFPVPIDLYLRTHSPSCPSQLDLPIGQGQVSCAGRSGLALLSLWPIDTMWGRNESSMGFTVFIRIIIWKKL